MLFCYIALGPHVCEAPRRKSYEKIIAGTENMCSVIKEDGKEKRVSENEFDRKATELREEVKEILKKAKDKKYTINLTKPEEEMRGMKKP